MYITFKEKTVNPIRKKLADFLISIGKNGIKTMDPDSLCARSFNNSDREVLLKEDINRICEEVSIIEAGKLLNLSTKLITSNQEQSQKNKQQIKEISSAIIGRVEKKIGKLNLPLECRELLMNL